MHKQIFVNLAIKDLDRSMAFFQALGYTFNPQFTNKEAACLVLGENLFAMLLTEPFFKSFIKTDITDATKQTEVLIALSVESRDRVNELVDKAVATGATDGRKEDHGWMYSRSFQDLDGHAWELVYMDISQAPGAPGQEKEGA